MPYAAAVGVCAVGLASLVLWIAIGLMRASPQGKCPRCAYVLRGLLTSDCPECGVDTAACRRRRPVWLLGVAGALVLGGLGALGWIAWRSGDWISALPTSYLIEHAPWEDAWGQPSTNAFDVELKRRYRNGQLTVGERRMLAARSLQVAGQAAPVEFPPATIAGTQLRAAATTAMSGPFERIMRVRVAAPWGQEAEAQLKVWDSYSEVEYEGVTPDPWPLRLGIPPSAAQAIEVDVTLQEGNDVIWTGALTLPVRIVEHADEVAHADERPQVDAAVRAGLRVELRRQDPAPNRWDYPAPTSLYAKVFEPDDPVLAELLLSLHIEILHGDELVAQGPYMIGGKSLADGSTRGFMVLLDGDVDRILSADWNDLRWRLRIRSDPSIALLWTYTVPIQYRYWPGQIEIPLKDVPIKPRIPAEDGW